MWSDESAVGMTEVVADMYRVGGGLNVGPSTADGLSAADRYHMHR